MTLNGDSSSVWRHNGLQTVEIKSISTRENRQRVYDSEIVRNSRHRYSSKSLELSGENARASSVPLTPKSKLEISRTPACSLFPPLPPPPRVKDNSNSHCNSLKWRDNFHCNLKRVAKAQQCDFVNKSTRCCQARYVKCDLPAKSRLINTYVNGL